MMTKDSILKSRADSWYRVLSELAAGGQGTVYNVERIGPASTADGRMIAKLFHPHFQTEDTRKRLRFLVDGRFNELSEAICSPIDLIDHDGVLGHIAPMAPGASLEKVLQRPDLSFQDGLQIGAAVAHAFAVFHENQIAQGDPHANNVLVQHQANGTLEVHLIDLDNFAAPGVPLPSCLGQTWYMAPELRRRLAAPSVTTDLYALSVMLHEILLRRHSVEGFTDEANRFNDAMLSGVWIHDPTRRMTSDPVLPGFPTDVLDANLTRLFRAGLSDNPGFRPSALEWRDALVRSMKQIFACPMCGGPNVIDSSKHRCPHCHQPYPILKLVGAFGTIPLNQSSTPVTRDLLKGSSAVSARHAVIRRTGPEYRLEDTSANGTYRQIGDKWLRLPQHRELMNQPLLAAGDRLRFANVEAQIQQM